MTNSEEPQLLHFANPRAGSVPIAYRYAKPEHGKHICLWLPGFKSDMDSTKASALAHWAKQQGAGCLRFDYSGHGLSGGKFEDGTLSVWLAQAQAVLGLIEASLPVVFVGSSMGGWIALLLAQKLFREGCRLPSALVLIAPAWEMTALMWEQASEEAKSAILEKGVFYRPSAYSEEPYTITKALIDDGNLHRLEPDGLPQSLPIRIIHGYMDRDVPWHRSLKLIERSHCHDIRLTLVKDGEHRLSRPRDLALMYENLSEFI
jgi:alpha-beta hydrolase superfamily lysophospholipase